MAAIHPAPILIDTDMGCDDAIAAAWLLGQPEARVVGITSVFGNSSVENTTANVLTLLDALGVAVPVTMGAHAPLAYPYLPLGAFIHGPDGFWGAQKPHDLSALGGDAPGVIAAAARAYPGLTVLAIGPLTNIARAVLRYPQDLAGVRLVALVGARAVGNITPAAEFNAFADPHALAAVLESQMQIDLITCDAFEGLLLKKEGLVERLARGNTALAALLTHLLEGYGQAEGHGDTVRLVIPDLAAAIYAMHPELGEALPATVRVIVEGEYTRGQTVIAITPQHRITLSIGATGIAQMAMQTTMPGFDVGAEMAIMLGQLPQNTRAVLRIDGEAMGDRLIPRARHV
jgi:inosine-uridine nucleoside N-ribohydrolase